MQPKNNHFLLAHRIPADVYYSNGNSKLELSLSPEDLLEILQSVTTQDQTDRVQRVMIDHMQQNKVVLNSVSYLYIWVCNVELLSMVNIKLLKIY